MVFQNYTDWEDHLLLQVSRQGELQEKDSCEMLHSMGNRQRDLRWAHLKLLRKQICPLLLGAVKSIGLVYDREEALVFM